jgi:hypothetical protein
LAVLILGSGIACLEGTALIGEGDVTEREPNFSAVSIGILLGGL